VNSSLRPRKLNKNLRENPGRCRTGSCVRFPRQASGTPAVLARNGGRGDRFSASWTTKSSRHFCQPHGFRPVKDKKTIGEISRDDTLGVRSFAIPVGVVAGLTPSTNPTSTALFKAIIAIKAGNAIVFSPHPNAQRCILQTVKVIRQAIIEAGGNEDLVGCITIPTIQATTT
jgi:hypothetical protein